MPKTKKKSTSQSRYVYEWSRKNMKQINFCYKKEFVEEFNAACKQLGLVKSQIVKDLMKKTIKKAQKQAQ